MSQVEISPVRDKKDLKAFIDLPWSIYAGDPNWVPPIKRMQKRLLNPAKHPYWQFSRRELFLARRSGQVVGRVMAHVDSNHNQFHHEKMGAWGFFESIEDPEVSRALFQAVEDWHRSRGSQFLRGPLNPSTNYEVAMLIEGFDMPPVLMMTYNPAYYPELVEDYGFTGEKDLFSFYSDQHKMHQWDLSLAERIAKRSEITIRLRDDKRLDDDIALLNNIYRDCWSDNWGFVPTTDREIKESARDLKMLLPMADRGYSFFLCHKGKEVGGCLVLPDFYQLQKILNGSMGPIALLRMWLKRREMTGLRCLMLGVPKGIRRAGFALVGLAQIESIFQADTQFHTFDMGWTLEDNTDVNQMLLKGGMDLYKRYRIYRKDL